MQSKISSRVIILVLIGVLNLNTGCAVKRWWNTHFGPKTGSSQQQPPPIGTAGEHSIIENPNVSAADLEKMRGQFASVLFDYDSARIKPTEMTKVEMVAAAMKGNSKKLIIEGHTDERGTAEYNRSLGEKRAGAAREALQRQGIDSNRISTISYGKDRPIDTGHDDAAHAKNRRAEFLLTGP